MTEPLLRATDLVKTFVRRSGVLRRPTVRISAVDRASFEVGESETLGVVGESGSGKSTVARLVSRLVDLDAGRVEFAGVDLGTLAGRQLRRARRDLQLVFQDPYSSLDPSASIADILGEPLEAHFTMSRRERRRRAGELLERVGLAPEHLNRRPAQFSGGQRQRIAIARALALGPKLIICDEPVSALDVSIQSQVLNLLKDLQDADGIAYLFIAHDLAVVRHLSHRIAVMYLGQIMETGPAEDVYTAPKHPYTEALLSAIPLPDPPAQRARKRIVLAGDIPSPANPPGGCRFHTRCPYAMPVCMTQRPAPLPLAGGGWVACHLHTDGPRLGGRSVTELRAPTPALHVGPIPAVSRAPSAPDRHQPAYEHPDGG